MTGILIGFVIWFCTGCFFIGMGIYSLFAQKTLGFWANQEVGKVTDRKKYNQAMCKLFFAFGVGLIFLGIPLLDGQNSAGIIISILGTMFESIIAMVIYITVIERRYKKK